MRAVRRAFSGSTRAIQRALVTVNDATGTLPTESAHTCGPPSSATSESASGADRVSFHSNAALTTSPRSSRATMPCCCPATAIASTPSSMSCVTSASASSQACGWTSVPSGCATRRSRTSAPLSASRTTSLTDWVEESRPATSMTVRLPRRRSRRVEDDALVHHETAVWH